MAAQNQVDAEMVIATVQTLASPSRLAQLLAAGPIDYVITDEAHHCHLPGASIATEHGAQAIEDIAVGDKVWGWNGAEWGLHQVDNTFAYWYDGPIYEIRTASGRSVRVTPNHRLYSGGKPVYATDLTRNHTLSLPAVRLGNNQRQRRPATFTLASSGPEALSAVLCSVASRGNRRPRRRPQGRLGSLPGMRPNVRQAGGRWSCIHAAPRRDPQHRGYISGPCGSAVRIRPIARGYRIA